MYYSSILRTVSSELAYSTKETEHYTLRNLRLTGTDKLRQLYITACNILLLPDTGMP